MLLLLIISVLLMAKSLLSKEQLSIQCDEFQKKKQAVAQAVLESSGETYKKRVQEWETLAQQSNVETTEQLVAQLDTIIEKTQKDLDEVKTGKLVNKRRDDYLFDALPQVLGVNTTDKRAMLAIIRNNQVVCYMISREKGEKLSAGLTYLMLIDEIRKIARQRELFVLILADGGQMGAAWKFIKDLRMVDVDCCLDVITEEWEPILAKLE